MRLIISWDVFAGQIENFIIEAKEILEKKYQVSDVTSLNEVKWNIEHWNKKCHNFLQESFDSKNNEYANHFYAARASRYTVNKKEKDFNQVKQEAFEDLRVKLRSLEYYPKILGVSDAVIKPAEIDLEARKKYNTEDILDLILEKLYELYDDYYHSVKDILEGNGIHLKRQGEDSELIRWLEDEGLVKGQLTLADAAAQLTPRGKMYIEDKRKVKSADYTRISGSQEEINIKIDKIIDELEKLGLGQEILYDELEELKDLYSKLDKRNWGQVLKGKLIDLGLSKVISTDIMKGIYVELTDQVLKLS
jgi:hypothetical protein